MIRCIIDLYVIEETEDAYWFSTATNCEFSDIKKLAYVSNSNEAREVLRERGHLVRRMGKDEKAPVHEFVQERIIGHQCEVQQVTQWPLKIDITKEIQRT